MIRLPRSAVRRFTHALLGAASVVLGGCAGTPFVANPPLMPGLKAALQPSSEAAAAPVPAAPSAPAAVAKPNPNPANSAATREDALLPLAALTAGRAERRFSVVLNNAAPDVVFMALLAETPLSVAVDPSVKGPLSISLKDVTLRESLDLLRELHGLEYKVIGRHILVSAAQLQTRIFTVDYPSFNRSGRSELRVLSGSITGNAAQSSPGGGQQNPYNTAGATGGGSTATNTSQESSRISTAQRNDLWGEIETTVKLIIGDKEGRSVVVSPQTGNIVVRALPREIRAINEYLEATRISVQRQVMLEAKVVEVQLRDSERTGINWSAFKLGLSTRASGGVISPGGSLSPSGASTSIGDGLLTVSPGATLESAATAAGSLLGLAFQTRNFAAVLDFLGTQGNTQVLSSPRIATMNNQKAVLKVGTDDFFVTSISSTTTAVGNTTATTPNIGVQPFFSGISLDVTPNIDAGGFITLHVHPSVSVVSERTKVINLGTQGSYSLPLASSEINESDAVVRAHDGNIIAIGGLMRQATANSDSGVPGTEGTGLFRKLLGGQTSRLSEKRELVILLKPTIVDPSQEDAELRRDSLQRLLDWTETQPTLKPTKAEVPRAAAVPAPVARAPNPTAPTAAAVTPAATRAAVVVPQSQPESESLPPLPAAVLSFAAMGRVAETAPPSTMNWAALSQAFAAPTPARSPAQAAAQAPLQAPVQAPVQAPLQAPSSSTAPAAVPVASANTIPSAAVQTAADARRAPGNPVPATAKAPVAGAKALVAVNLQPKAAGVAVTVARLSGSSGTSGSAAVAAPPLRPAPPATVNPVTAQPGLPTPNAAVLNWLGEPRPEPGWFKPVSHLRRAPTWAAASHANGYGLPRRQGAPPSG